MKYFLISFFIVLGIKSSAQETLQSVTTRGDITTNGITISSPLPDGAGFGLNSSSSVLRWMLRLTNAETGSGNAGSDFSLITRKDDGSFLSMPLFIKRSNGNVGIGTTNPTAPLHAFGGTAMNSGWNRTSVLEAVYPVQVFNSNSSKYAGVGYDHGNGLFFWVNATSDNVSGNGTMAMSIQNNGNVLIGAGLAQYNPAYKLNVNGKARANEIVVNTTGADFVFENNYKLRPLAEVESFVKQNKHLPEIPTAKTMQAEGVGVSELQTKLLQKVEELTLYLIEKDKQLIEQMKKNKAYEDRLLELERIIKTNK